MDISMYGQHDQPHTSSYHHTASDSVYHPYYNTNDAGTGYGQTAPGYHHQSVGYHETYHHHHHENYGTQILYDGSGTSPPPDPHFYSQGSLGQLGLHLESPTDPIISTDNGLSYTNLDYNNGGTGINNGPVNSGLYPHDTYHQSPAYIRSPIDDTKGYQHEADVNFQAIDFNQHHQQQQQQQHLHHTSHQQHHVSHQQVFAKQECQQRLGQPHGQQAHEQPQNVGTGTTHNSHSVTTYRWMQVKRNVPKPAGSYLKNTSTLLVTERNVCSSVGNLKSNLFSSNPPRVLCTC